jgi:hypothetical protein
MLGILTYEAVLVLTRRRLKHLHDVLQVKIKSGLAVNDLERQVAFLAEKARNVLELPPHPPDDGTLRDVALGVSQFAALGAVGLEIPRFAAFFAPSQSWLADTIRRGNPDPNREMVFTRSTDFLLRFWTHVNTLIDADTNITDKPGAKANMSAYLLGHACHIAADVVAHPFVRGLEWRLGDATQAKITPEQIAGAIDATVANNVFGRATTRGRTWSQFLLAADQIPGPFFEAYSTALEEIFGAADRRKGFKAFQSQLDDNDPPPLSKRLIEDGYSTFSSMLERTYSWTYGDWLLATLPMFIPTVLTFPIMAAMPNGSELFRENSTVDKERGWFEVVMFPVAANAIVPLGFSLGIAFLSYFGAGKETIFALVSAGVLTVASITFFATLGADLPAGVRWPLLFVVPLVVEIVQMIFVLARGGQDTRHWQLALSSITHLLLVLLFIAAYAAFLHFGIEALKDENWGVFFGLLAIWLLIAGAAWLVMCLFLQGKTVQDIPPANSFVAERKHFIRLFDRASLFNDPALAAARVDHLPTMAAHFFPSDRRPLFKIRWEGAGSMSVRSDRDSLVFSNSGAVGADNQTIMAPLAPMTVAEYARFLTRSVRDSVAGPFGGNLKVEPFEPADQDYELPPGEVFANHSELPANDGLATQAARDAEAASFKVLPGTSGDPYILYHAPRSRLASYFGTTGPIVFDEDRQADLTGPGSILLAGPGPIVVGLDTRFWTMFRPGDVIATTGLATNEARVVTAVTDDLHLGIGLPFTAAVVPGTTYIRQKQSRTQDTLGVGTINIAVGPTVTGAGTAFDSFFMPGDIIRAPVPGAPQERTVVSVTSATAMTLDSPFSSPLVVATPYGYERVGSESLQGFKYVADADDFLFSGPSLMDRAADLATLLCLGAVSHTIPVTGQAVPNAANPVNKVYQVFRNWNLEERGVNEWKMLITGRATSEKGGDPTQPDPLQPDIPSTWTLLSTKGEDTANLLGWVPLLQKWTDMARRPGVDSKAKTVFFPGDPVNLDLSRAMAYLLDLAEPDPLG